MGSPVAHGHSSLPPPRRSNMIGAPMVTSSSCIVALVGLQDVCRDAHEKVYPHTDKQTDNMDVVKHRHVRKDACDFIGGTLEVAVVTSV